MANAATKRKSAGRLARLFDFQIYKKTQGRRVRQLTAAGLGLVVVLGAREIMNWLEGIGAAPMVTYGVPAMMVIVGAWLIFRVYNNVRFADFLVATEAEMSKVNWSSKKELKNATVVVLVLTFMLAAYLFVMDRIWETILKGLGVLRLGEGAEEAAAALRSVLDHFLSA